MIDDSSSRIATHLRSVVAQSATGTKLPSTRALAKQFGAGPVTVQRAIATLVGEGIVETRPGAGNFVRRARSAVPGVDLSWQTTSLGAQRTSRGEVGSPLATAGPDTIVMHSGYLSDDLLPMRELRAALTRVTKGDTAFTRPPVSGLPELRRWFAAELSDYPGAAGGWRDSDVAIASGGQGALASLFRALAGPGDDIVVESPTYWGAIAAAHQAGLRIVPIATADDGPAPDALDAALSRGARLVYAQPTFTNPTGIVWSQRRRAEILDVVAAHGAFLIEDDWARGFGIVDEPAPVATLDTRGHVIYLRSLTKSLSLSMRVAAVCARGPARIRLEDDLAVNDLYVSPLLQAATLDVVSGAGWRTHLRRLRGQLQQRRDALVDEVRGVAGLELTRIPGGATNLWLRLADGIEPNDVVAQTLRRGLSISPGSEWFPTQSPAPFIRLNYGAVEPSRYREAAEILGEVLGDWR
ncbi:PLP-dependent aminotransferase family protein [Gordonia sp. TBRC 11910]|uniref:PLP-dependent aminotransferase family protein n=1 Tax=Gordonia asplenii TaxID=2725283 RepID=A0A848KPL6_9ACTN|nr:PLP-dependent aminotransferase family protein [Gordonia asplenii]NMO00616.1 PLP-dependent aminotransferase family protein [Gordonia asplenii]